LDLSTPSLYPGTAGHGQMAGPSPPPPPPPPLFPGSHSSAPPDGTGLDVFSKFSWIVSTFTRLLTPTPPFPPRRLLRGRSFLGELDEYFSFPVPLPPCSRFFCTLARRRLLFFSYGSPPAYRPFRSQSSPPSTNFPLSTPFLLQSPLSLCPCLT